MPPVYPDRNLVYWSLLAVLPMTLSEPDREEIAELITTEIVDSRHWLKMGPPTVSLGQSWNPLLAANASSDVTVTIGGSSQSASLITGNDPLLGSLSQSLLSHSGTSATVRVTNTGLLPILANQFRIVAASARDPQPPS